MNNAQRSNSPLKSWAIHLKEARQLNSPKSWVIHFDPSSTTQQSRMSWAWVADFHLKQAQQPSNPRSLGCGTPLLVDASSTTQQPSKSYGVRGVPFFAPSKHNNPTGVQFSGGWGTASNFEQAQQPNQYFIGQALQVQLPQWPSTTKYGCLIGEAQQIQFSHWSSTTNTVVSLVKHFSQVGLG